MKKVILIIGIAMISFLSNAQKIAKIESGGKLKICTLDNSNYAKNCTTVESYGVVVGSIGNSKIAILYETGKLKVCSVDDSNYTKNCTTVESAGVSNVQLSGDQRIIITYESGKKKACDIDNSNYSKNCSTL